MKFSDLAAAYDQRRTTYLSDLGSAAKAQETVQRLTAEAGAERYAARVDEAVALLFQAYSDAEHAQLTRRIEDLVTKGIEAVFGPIYRFQVTTTAERGQAALRFTLVAPDGSEHPVMDAQGGGLASIIGFILRVVVLALRPGGRQRLLVLDETFGMVSAEYHDQLALFLRTLVDDLALQVVLITHAPQQGIYADRVYRVTNEAGASRAIDVGTESL